MTYQTKVTSKGQMTLPAPFRKKLGIKPGERLSINMQGNKVIIEKIDWLSDLRKIQAKNQAHMRKNNIKPMSDEELDDAINQAAEQAALEKYQNSLR